MYVTEPLPIDPRQIQSDQIRQILAATRSTRFFTDKEVSMEKVKAILDAMIRAPSAGNEQNRSYYVFPARNKVVDMELDMHNSQERTAKRWKTPSLKK